MRSLGAESKMKGVLVRRGERHWGEARGWRQRWPRGLQAKGGQGLLVMARAWKRRGKILVYRFQGEHGPASTSILDFWSPESRDKPVLLPEAQFVVL